MARVGVYPGSFNPPTVAHLAIAAAARGQRRLDRVVLVLSQVTLDKEHVDRPRFDHRLEVVEAEASQVSWLEVAVTEHQLLVDIAHGHDVLIMGADKWVQVNDPRYYEGDPRRRDEAVAALPELAIAPRPPHTVPPEHRLDVPGHLAEVSSTSVRFGRLDAMTPAARDFDLRTGAWSDPERYERWLSRR